jgi:UDP-N-acetylmuramate--alanine ligase
VLRKGLDKFGGVKRRFTRVGEWNGAAIIDDYGHHPVEIAAVLKAARQAFSGPIVAVVQPHRYTRLRDLFDQFCTCLHQADAAIVAPVYPAGEAPIAGIDRDALMEGLRRHGHKSVRGIGGPEDLPGAVEPLAKPGGAIVCLGAGSITGWAAGLEAALKAGRRDDDGALDRSLPSASSLAPNARSRISPVRVGGPAELLSPGRYRRSLQLHGQ